MIELTPVQSIQNLQLVWGSIALGLKGLTRLRSTSADMRTEDLRTDQAGSARMPLGRMMTKLLGFSPPPCIHALPKVILHPLTRRWSLSFPRRLHLGRPDVFFGQQNGVERSLVRSEPKP